MPSKAEVLQYAAQSNARIIDIVKHFYGAGASCQTHKREYTQIRNWLKRTTKKRRTKPVKGTQEVAPVPEAAGTLLEELQQEIDHAEQARARMAADHSWSAWQLTARYIRKLRDQLREQQERSGADFDPQDDEQVLAAVLALPPRFLRDERVWEAVKKARSAE